MSKTKQPGPGRPPISKELKAHDYKISMTESQMVDIDQIAKALELTRSDYIRMLHKKFKKNWLKVGKSDETEFNG